MGQNLSEPKTEKETSQYESERFVVGTSSMQGWRVEMEDASSVQLCLNKEETSAFFAVFDGHGGPRFASYCSDNMHKQLLSNPDFGEGNIRCALKSTFLDMDKRLQEDASLKFQYEPGGTTAVAVLVKENKIFCANAGDSRATASVGGKVQELSHDHKPFNPDEESRIFRAGGWVEFNRVNGNLALSRAIGDFNFKENKDLSVEEQIVTANPEILVVDVTPQHEFIVLACDGVWDVMSNPEVVEFVRSRIADRMLPHLICEALLDHCLAPDCRMGGLGCDNMSIILVCLLQEGESYSDLCQRCAECLSVHPQPDPSSPKQPREYALHSWGASNGKVPHPDKDCNHSPIPSSKLGCDAARRGATGLGLRASVEVSVVRRRNTSSSSSEGERSTDIDEELNRAKTATAGLGEGSIAGLDGGSREEDTTATPSEVGADSTVETVV